MKQYLVKLVVQAVWVTIDNDGDAQEHADKTLALQPKEIRPYVDELFEFVKRAKEEKTAGETAA